MIGRRRTKAEEAAPVAEGVPEAPTLVEEAARVEGELADARNDLITAERELATAREDYDRATSAAVLKEAIVARSRIAECEVAVDVARRHVERLQAELGPMLDGLASAEELAERNRLHEEAVNALQAYEAAFRRLMPAIRDDARGLLRTWAMAELAREAAAAKGVQLPRADAFRDIPGTPREEIRRIERDLWLNPFGGGPYDDARQGQIRAQPDGAGALIGANHTQRVHQKRRFAETTYRPAIPARLAPNLAEILVLPAMMAGDPAGWTKPDGRSGFSPKAVLAKLEELETPAAAQRPQTPEPRKELRPIEPAREVTMPREPRSIPLERSMR